MSHDSTSLNVCESIYLSVNVRGESGAEGGTSGMISHEDIIRAHTFKQVHLTHLFDQVRNTFYYISVRYS